MNGKTHALFALVLFLFFMFLFSYSFLDSLVFFSVLFLSALLPDIDAMRSFFGKRVRCVEFLIGHRTLLHSLWILGIGTYLFFYFTSQYYALAFFIGYASHLSLDSLTYAGIYLFYPFGPRIRGRFKTGGFQESVLQIVFLLLILILFLAIFLLR